MQRSPLEILTRLVTTRERLVCGIMSGTSLDGVDVALVRVSGAGTSTRVTLEGYSETLYPEEIQQRIFDNSEASSSSVDDICLLHTGLAYVYADAVRQLCVEKGITPRDIDLIGLHGQTLRHLPQALELGPHTLRSTFQAGSGSTLATLLGVPVVHDFRAADMAAGGQGAPLVPYVEYLLFRDGGENRVLVNIGGIANLTWIPPSASPAEVIAFDTGPGNMICDALTRRFYGREFDEEGRIAASGTVNPDLIAWMTQHPYFRQLPPKSTGREMFGEPYMENLLQIADELGIARTEDILATAAECTVRSIALQVRALLGDGTPFRLFLSGGGARNRFFTEGLRYALPAASLGSTIDAGIPPDAKEALCFAILANEWLEGHPANLPSVTGADRPVILGSFSTPG